jgi:hypothetical protein
MKAALRKKRWLFREWIVTTPVGEQTVCYSGRRYGYEFVQVNGEVAVKTRSWVWFVPKFEFKIGDTPARVDVRVWPWFTIRAIRLQVADEICYSEGIR